MWLGGQLFNFLCQLGFVFDNFTTIMVRDSKRTTTIALCVVASLFALLKSCKIGHKVVQLHIFFHLALISIRAAFCKFQMVGHRQRGFHVAYINQVKLVSSRSRVSDRDSEYDLDKKIMKIINKIAHRLQRLSETQRASQKRKRCLFRRIGYNSSAGFSELWAPSC